MARSRTFCASSMDAGGPIVVQRECEGFEVGLRGLPESNHACDGGHDLAVVLDADAEIEHGFEESFVEGGGRVRSERGRLDGGAVELAPVDEREREKGRVFGGFQHDRTPVLTCHVGNRTLSKCDGIRWTSLRMIRLLRLFRLWLD